MIKPIAMKMTQQEFESVVEILRNIKNCTISHMDSFNLCPYLITNLGGIAGRISNMYSSSKDKQSRTVYEKFDKDILFDALGVSPVNVVPSPTPNYWSDTHNLDGMVEEATDQEIITLKFENELANQMTSAVIKELTKRNEELQKKVYELQGIEVRRVGVIY